MRAKTFCAAAALFLCGTAGYAQWSSTPTPAVIYRYDDAYFLHPSLGWAINYSNNYDGMVIKTSDGGQSWQTLLSGSGATFRDIAFTDSLHGWIGTLQTGLNAQDTVIMYQTVDGGASWSPVPNFPGPRPAGICGMRVINDSTVYACGRYKGPAGFYKTTNNGQSWSYVDMSAYAGGLVDMHFFTPDSGFAVGTSGIWNLGSGIILFTSDGGSTWQVRHTSTHSQEICWKIFFPSANTGYVSLQSFRGSGPQYFLKTSDGGQTWQDLSFMSSGNFNAQGIGFINDTTGWIGGGSYNYKTTNGGLSWTTETWGATVNRFRFFSDTIGYAAGAKVYKFDPSTISIAEHAEENFVQVFPNPFSQEIALTMQAQHAKRLRIAIRNCLGQLVYEAQENDPGATQTVDLHFLPAGIYLLEVTADELRTVRKLVKE